MDPFCSRMRRNAGDVQPRSTAAPAGHGQPGIRRRLRHPARGRERRDEFAIAIRDPQRFSTGTPRTARPALCRRALGPKTHARAARLNRILPRATRRKLESTRIPGNSALWSFRCHLTGATMPVVRGAQPGSSACDPGRPNYSRSATAIQFPFDGAASSSSPCEVRRDSAPVCPRSASIHFTFHSPAGACTSTAPPRGK